MSFKAILSLEGKDYSLLECRCVLDQQRDNIGKPASGVTGGTLHLIMEDTNDDIFGFWIADPEKKHDGKIILNRIDQESKFKEITFKGAYLIDLMESFAVSDLYADNYESKSIYLFNNDLRQTYDVITEHQLRTGSSYVLYCKISSEKITIDGIEHDNKW